MSEGLHSWRAGFLWNQVRKVRQGMWVGGSPVKNLPGRPVGGEGGREGCKQKGHPPLHCYSQPPPRRSRVQVWTHLGLPPQR